jgi:hypothetical protein
MRTSDQVPAKNSNPSTALPCVGDELGGFEPSLQEFTEVARELRDLGACIGLGIVGHGHLEKTLYYRSQAISLQMLQDLFDQISADEEVCDDVIGPEGTVLRYPRRRVRTLETLLGPVTVNRLGYRDRGTASVFPLDAKLNMPLTRYSHGLQERAAWLLSYVSYDSVLEHLAVSTGACFPKRQLMEMALDYVLDFDDFYAGLPCFLNDDNDKRMLLVVSVDGKGIVVRWEDLREATRRRANDASRKLNKRLTAGEKRNRKRMAEAAVIYEIEPYKRSAEDIVFADHRPKDAPRPCNKRVWASVEKEAAEVLEDLMEDVKRRDPNGQKTLVILIDGLEAQIRLINDALKRHGRTDAIVIQDYFHVCEYMWRAARCFYREKDPAGEVWVNERLLQILKGNSSNVAAGMTRSATKQNLSKSARADVDRAARYLIKNRERLDYARALKIGAPIGTGVVEGAVRHLIKARMECSGARWSLRGAEAVLKLRALRMSGDWDAYCEYHLKQEFRRNYPQYELKRAV